MAWFIFIGPSDTSCRKFSRAWCNASLFCAGWLGAADDSGAAAATAATAVAAARRCCAPALSPRAPPPSSGGAGGRSRFANGPSKDRAAPRGRQQRRGIRVCGSRQRVRRQIVRVHFAGSDDAAPAAPQASSAGSACIRPRAPGAAALAPPTAPRRRRRHRRCGWRRRRRGRRAAADIVCVRRSRQAVHGGRPAPAEPGAVAPSRDLASLVSYAVSSFPLRAQPPPPPPRCKRRRSPAGSRRPRAACRTSSGRCRRASRARAARARRRGR